MKHPNAIEREQRSRIQSDVDVKVLIHGHIEQLNHEAKEGYKSHRVNGILTARIGSRKFSADDAEDAIDRNHVLHTRGVEVLLSVGCHCNGKRL